MIYEDLLLAILRVVIGVLFAAHGAQKLFGWFGGPGFDGHTKAIASLGLRPASLWAFLSAVGESLGGVLLALGLLTPVASAVLIGVMLVAILRVHWDKGLWNANGGYEYNLVLLITSFVLGALGPNAYALDQHISLPWPHQMVYLVSLVVSIVLALLAVVTARPTAHTTGSEQQRATA